jgi:hypothetical protein
LRKVPELPASGLEGIAVESLERRTLDSRVGIQHGDLHGSNVFVGGNGSPLLIDYGEVGPAPLATDPVVLELSLLFHPRGREISGGWPSEEQAGHWATVDEFVQGCPFPEFVRATRSWAQSSGGGGTRAVFASAYAHCVRQVPYPDTDNEIARAVITSIIADWR